MAAGPVESGHACEFDEVPRRQFIQTAVRAVRSVIGAGAAHHVASTAMAADDVAIMSAAVVERIRVTRGPTRHRAFPALVQLKNGTLLLLYREGSNHWETDDSVLKLTRSSDDGKTWSEPRTLLQENGWGFAAHHGPLVLSDGSVLVPAVALRHHDGPFFDFRVYAMRSTDGGNNWTVKQIGPLPGWVWQNQYGRVVEIDGELWLPGGAQPKGEKTWYNGFFVSRDNGKTWPHWRAVAAGRNEKDILELLDRQLVAMMRGDTHSYCSFSSDRGKTWSPKKPIDLFAQSPSLLMLPSGNVIFAYRQVRPKTPFGVGLALSTDNARSWRELDPIYVAPQSSDNPRDCAYPSMVLNATGDVLCAYYTAPENGDSHIELARVNVHSG